MSDARDRRWPPFTTLLGYGLVRLLLATYRHRPVTGEEHLEGLLTPARPAILACWHNRLLVCGDYIRWLMVRRRVRIAALVSPSRDGERIAPLGRWFGARIVRGSTFTGGTLGLRRLYREMARHGCSVATAPDGSRGPMYRCRPGTIVLAQLSGAPIVPLAYSADRVWRLGSWDRFMVPKPFARVALAVGAPMKVPAELHDQALAERCRELEERLNALVETAEAAVL